MANHRNIIKSDAEYTRMYENMHGMCSVSNSENLTKKFSYTENMYVDHEAGDGIIESIPGFRKLFSFGEKINGIHMQKLGTGAEFTLIHAGTKLYRYESASYDSLEGLQAIAELADTRSRSYVYGRRLYIMDGKKLLEIDEDGGVVTVEEGSTDACYVPTTYKDKLRHEERNLLTNKFKEEISVASSSDVSFGSPELIYSITDAVKMECAVVGIGEREVGPVHVPSHTVIGGKEYTVTEISASALRSNTTVTELITSFGLKKIGKYALWGATNLTRVVISPTVTTVGEYAFNDCASLNYLFLGMGVSMLGAGVLRGCDALTEISYAGNAESFAEIQNRDQLDGKSVVYNAEDRSATVSIPVFSPAGQITRVTVDDVNHAFLFLRASSQIVLSFEDKSEIEGRRVTVYGVLSDTDTEGFLSCELGGRLSPSAAILGCTVCEVFDGRIFLSGNPALAGAVFYSSITSDGFSLPLYFGNNSYFVDGSGDWTTAALLTTEGSLAVFKSGDDGSGSIFYHTPTGSSAKRTYPVSYIHGKVAAVGDAYTFLDDSVFLSPLGLTKLTRTSSDYREMRCISSDISSLLGKEDYSKISITEWQGYIVLLAGKNMYLGDATKRFTGGSDDYDWYYVTGVGTYLYDTPVYRYSSLTPPGFVPAEKPDTKAIGNIFGSPLENGEFIYHQKVDGKKVHVYPTQERHNGTFSPATVAYGDGKLLFFGTECGDLCVFNNDKRGVAPESVIASGGYDSFTYKKQMGDRIHPDFYSFAGRAPRYAVATALDDCGIAYLDKRTVPSSLVIKLKNFHTGKIYCEVGTDSGGFVSYGLSPASSICFRELSFSSFSATPRERSVISVDDRSHGWTEKQITIYTDEFCAPFGVYSISYRYKIKGKIKKTTT